MLQLTSPGEMDYFIARQPIFTIHKKLFAYELLFRGYAGYSIENVNGNTATTSLLSSAFLTEGIGEISGHRPCFINFTEELLLKNIAYSFSPKQLIVEILEDVNPTREVLAAVRKLAASGYRIVLDDFVDHPRFDPLLGIAEIVKVDVRLTPLDDILKTLRRLERFDVDLLAEKVESRQEFEKASKLGFKYFQGYFFRKPGRIVVKEIEPANISLVHLLAEVSRKKPRSSVCTRLSHSI